jgi:hypothetical protein
MPVTAGLVAGGSSGGIPSYDFPMTLSVSTTNVTGAAAGAAGKSSLSYTIGQAMSAPWDP